MADRLWVCHYCQMIGPEGTAAAHAATLKHRVVPLSREESAAVWREWERNRDHRVARLAAYARVGLGRASSR